MGNRIYWFVAFIRFYWLSFRVMKEIYKQECCFTLPNDVVAKRLAHLALETEISSFPPLPLLSLSGDSQQNWGFLKQVILPVLPELY